LNIYSDDNAVATALASSGWERKGTPSFDTADQPQTDQGDTMNLQSHIDVLKGRHSSLETKIAEEDRRPRPDDTAIARMKVEKLRLKEEMDRLSHQ
jgi:hypothetical protein